MDELGNILREARESKGLTLAEVQEKTRISGKFLAALEKAEYEALPTPVHVRGYLRNYARFLGLDPDPLLERYELSKNHRPGRPAPPMTDNGSSAGLILPREDQPFFEPVNVELGGHGRREGGSLQRWLIIVALFVSLALVANRYVPLLTGRGDGTQSLTEDLNAAVNRIMNDGETAASPTPDLGLIPGSSETLTSTSRNASIPLPTPTATRPLLPATLETVRLRLEITERTWMRVTIDGEVVFEGLARRGDDPYEWEASQEATLLTGNAIGIFVTLNDIQLGKLGGRGEVVEETWTATGSQ